MSTAAAIEVHRALGERTVAAGTAFFTRNRRHVTTTFDYDPAYLRLAGAPSIDPDLPLATGNQYVPRLPGAFADSAPDRWGRNLVMRRERNDAREEGRSARTLDDVDFLLGVSDHTRQGALRFRAPGSVEFLDSRKDVPRLIALPRLLNASDHVSADPSDNAAVKALLDAGTGSLGGARPKAAITLDDGSLGIAKFPHAHDEWSVMAWEATALDVADAAGIAVPWHRLVQVDERPVVLLRRFDRGAKGARFAYMSAMTVLGASDGTSSDYADVSAGLADVSAGLRADRLDLFARVALSVALHNTDDHLQNLGLLDTGSGWRMSPLFDVNPNPDEAASRNTSIAGALDADDEADGLAALSEDCGLRPAEREDALLRVIAGAARWETIARANGCPEKQLELMRPVIERGLRTLRQLV